MWLVMISNPSLRPPALNYLLRKLPKISDREAVAVVLGGRENVSLMVRAFASTLNDQQLLVQRGMLELLVQNFMLKSRMIPHEDLVILIKASLGIVLRKDMSLNRRLYAWLLGSEGNSQAQLTYFSTYAEKPAIQAVRGMLQENHSSSAAVNAQRPYKILISLMDKWELGQPIVNNIFIDSLTSLKSRFNPDVMQTANMWMDMMEPYSMCMKLFEILDRCFPGKKNSSSPEKDVEGLKLIQFTLESFKLTDEEIKHVHYPLMLASLSKKLKDALKNPQFIAILPNVDQCLSIILILMKQIPTSVYVDRPATVTTGTIVDEASQQEKKRFAQGENVLEYAREFYGFTAGNQQQCSSSPTTIEEDEEPPIENDEEEGDLSSSQNFKKNLGSNNLTSYQQQQQRGPQFDPLHGQLLVKEIGDNLTGFLIDFVNSYIVLPDNMLSGVDVGEEGKRLKHIDHHLERVLTKVCTAITLVAQQADATTELKRKDQLTQVLLKCSQQGNVFGVVDAGLTMLTTLTKQKRFVDTDVLKHLSEVKKVVDKLWGFLSPSLQLLHMRTVELLWLLIHVSKAHQIETIISNYLIHSSSDDDDTTERTASYEKFGIVWELSETIPEASMVLSRPMFLMLDLLREGTSPVDRRAGETWIRCHLKSYVRLLQPFLLTMLDKKLILRRPDVCEVDWSYQTFLKKKKEEDKKVTEIPYFIYIRPFDTDIIDYMFTTLITLITFGGLNVLKSCKNHHVEKDGTIAQAAQASLGVDDKPMTFLDVLVSISIRYVNTNT